ncbi:MAG: hypothetical protein ABWY49_07130, partial [Rhizobium sp.]
MVAIARSSGNSAWSCRMGRFEAVQACTAPTVVRQSSSKIQQGRVVVEKAEIGLIGLAVMGSNLAL